MNYILLSFLFFVISHVYGRMVNFSLVTFGGEAVVNVNGESVPMKRIDDYSSVRSVTINCPEEELEYSYSVDGENEGFTRILPADTLTTYNEFFGRRETLRPMLGLGYPEDKPQWLRSIGKTSLFDDSYIPTVIFDAGSRDFFISGNDTWTLGRFTIVLKDEVFTEENVPTKAQNRYNDKFQFRIKLENKIHKRRVFKFRSNSADPAFFRQSIYGDMAAAIGNPVHNQIVVRIYLSDGTPIGLYLMIEVTSSKSFIKSQFYGNEITGKIKVPKTGLGYPLDCSTGADFNLGQSISAFQFSEGENNEKINYLIEAMHQLDVNNVDDVKRFSREWFDLDIFFKALALEYLTGDWDSYWMLTTNFVMYDAPDESTDTTYKYYFIDQDFDLTFGIGLSDAVNLYGFDFPSQSYKTLVDRTWSIEEYDGPNRAAIDLFLRGGYTTEMFENHLIDIVKHVFNPVALGRRLDEYTNHYINEIEWDYSLEHLHIGADPLKTRYVWTVNDFYENMENVGKRSTPWGLKQWIEMRANAVAQEFGFEWDQVPLEPVIKEIDVENELSNLEKNPNYNYVERSAAISSISRTSIAFITLLAMIIGILF